MKIFHWLAPGSSFHWILESKINWRGNSGSNYKQFSGKMPNIVYTNLAKNKQKPKKRQTNCDIYANRMKIIE